MEQIDPKWDTDEWIELDSWWESVIQDHVPYLTDEELRTLNFGWGVDDWKAVDSMWKPYVERQQKKLSTLATVFEELNDVWKQSPSRYDVDPLTADWRVRGSVEGPIRIAHEEDWSHWLAQLIRTSSGSFTEYLLGEQFGERADVYREEPLHNPDGMNRRVDILVQQDQVGLSIEVKHHDTNFEKTLHTVELIERTYPQQWIHCLLIPEFNSDVLDREFSNRVQRKNDATTVIQTEATSDIQVVFWEDVTSALRQTLLSGEESDPHWESSAYLFITMVEQYIRSFRPTSAHNLGTMEQNDLVPVYGLNVLMDGAIDAQITYLQQVLDNYHE